MIHYSNNPLIYWPKSYYGLESMDPYLTLNFGDPLLQQYAKTLTQIFLFGLEIMDPYSFGPDSVPIWFFVFRSTREHDLSICVKLYMLNVPTFSYMSHLLIFLIIKIIIYIVIKILYLILISKKILVYIYFIFLKSNPNVILTEKKKKAIRSGGRFTIQLIRRKLCKFHL